MSRGAAATVDGSWTTRGSCCSLDPDGFFVQGADQQKAKTLCEGCPVRAECLADALDNRIEFGVWGGMTERERRRLLREHPRVTDWYPRLAEMFRRENERAARRERSAPAARRRARRTDSLGA